MSSTPYLVRDDIDATKEGLSLAPSMLRNTTRAISWFSSAYSIFAVEQSHKIFLVDKNVGFCKVAFVLKVFLVECQVRQPFV